MPKTVKECRALPEVNHPFIDTTEVIQPDGATLLVDQVRPICPIDTSPDAILLFRDADGRTMQVVYTESGPAKCPFRL